MDVPKVGPLSTNYELLQTDRQIDSSIRKRPKGDTSGARQTLHSRNFPTLTMAYRTRGSTNDDMVDKLKCK